MKPGDIAEKSAIAMSGDVLKRCRERSAGEIPREIAGQDRFTRCEVMKRGDSFAVES
jgi:hypothetical protein